MRCAPPVIQDLIRTYLRRRHDLDALPDEEARVDGPDPELGDGGGDGCVTLVKLAAAIAAVGAPNELGGCVSVSSVCV